MSDFDEHKLIALESRMSELVALRNARVSMAEAAIRKANQEFDKAALPLARRINALRELLETEEPPTRRETVTRYREPDPDWSPEEIAHYRELGRRGSISKSR